MKIKNKHLQVPIIQGGMGVGVSLSELAGAVALNGGMGVISSVNIGFKEKDFLSNPQAANLHALEKHIERAKEISKGNGLIAVNIMTAVTNYENTCKCAVNAGTDAIISGAGLPLKLPEYTKNTDTLIAPIVSSAKAAEVLCKSYTKKYNVCPDFLVIEGAKAGGHLGFSREELLGKKAKDNETILKEVLAVVREYEKEYQTEIPVFIAGGVFDGKDIRHFMQLGAAGVQLATRFIATDECDADLRFKQAVVNAQAKDIKIIHSPVGMPARAVQSPLLDRLERGEKFPALYCNNCLSACPKSDKTPYCISRALIEAVNGNWEDGLFFCGENADRVKKIVSVKELMETLMREYNEN
jgi:NAD(P)H-dependent flavin oxidoreductase YrpB (nitropropane dioxygenase family)